MERATLTVREISEQLHISLPTAYMLVKKDGFPKIHIGSRILIPADEFTKWLSKESKERR